MNTQKSMINIANHQQKIRRLADFFNFLFRRIQTVDNKPQKIPLTTWRILGYNTFKQMPKINHRLSVAFFIFVKIPVFWDFLPPPKKTPNLNVVFRRGNNQHEARLDTYFGIYLVDNRHMGKTHSFGGLRTKLSAIGYSRFLSRYTRKKMISKTLDVYNSLV